MDFVLGLIQYNAEIQYLVIFVLLGFYFLILWVFLGLYVWLDSKIYFKSGMLRSFFLALTLVFHLFGFLLYLVVRRFGDRPLEVLMLDELDEEARRREIHQCVGCSRVVIEEENFCHECGEVNRKKCTKCGELIWITDRYCVYCGSLNHNFYDDHKQAVKTKTRMKISIPISRLKSIRLPNINASPLFNRYNLANGEAKEEQVKHVKQTRKKSKRRKKTKSRRKK